MTRRDTKPTMRLRNDPRRLGLFVDAPCRLTAERSEPLRVVTIGSNRRVVTVASGHLCADHLARCSGTPRSQSHAGGIC